MQELEYQDEPRMLADDPVVHEWDDGSCLALAVERLAAVRRRLDQLRRWRKGVVAGAFVALAAVCSISALACSAGPVSLVAGLLVTGLIVGCRVCLSSELDHDVEGQQARADAWARDVQDRLERTDWLLEP